MVDRIIGESEVIVLGKLTAEGVSKMQFGGSQIVRSTRTKEIVSLADDLKAAASDSLKKCASHLGVALSIYGREFPPETPVANKTNGTVTPEQLKAIKEIRTQRGMTPEEVQDLCERMFKTREVTGLNQTQATTFISALKMDETPTDASSDEPPF